MMAIFHCDDLRSKGPIPLIIFALFVYVFVGLTGYQLGLMHCKVKCWQDRDELSLQLPLLRRNNESSALHGRAVEFSPVDYVQSKVVSTTLPVDPMLLDMKPLEIQSVEKCKAPDKLPAAMQTWLAGFARVPRDEFIQSFDVGVPWQEQKSGNKEVLLLYTSEGSRPHTFTTDTMFPEYSVVSATENCHTLKVVMTNANADKECIAVMGQWQSAHVHKFMRLDTSRRIKNNALNGSLPLRYVSRVHNRRNEQIHFQGKDQSLDYYQVLSTYLSGFEETLMRLRPLAAKVAGKSNTIVVMVTNFGQSELLVNFVCSARARGLDLSHVLLFATDQATTDLAQSLGISVFDVKNAFGKLPIEAARQFGEPRFGAMVTAKIYAVHVVTKLGYDVLLHDVDIVWYRNPLELFHRLTSETDFDLYFQDDGNRINVYSPFSANTGCFYVRHNERTSFFFSSIIRFGDMLHMARNDQEVINMLMSDHASLSGMRVKVLARDTADGEALPGGFHYHNRYGFMKDVLRGKKKPYLFHMSWTNNKDNKLKYFQQMGDWYVRDQCIGKSVDEIKNKSREDINSLCCSNEPVLTCHYRDKPSKKPCKDSPPIDAGRPSFW